MPTTENPHKMAYNTVIFNYPQTSTCSTKHQNVKMTQNTFTPHTMQSKMVYMFCKLELP